MHNNGSHNTCEFRRLSAGVRLADLNYIHYCFHSLSAGVKQLLSYLGPPSYFAGFFRPSKEPEVSYL